jgi:hypothetical protein
MVSGGVLELTELFGAHVVELLEELRAERGEALPTALELVTAIGG